MEFVQTSMNIHLAKMIEGIIAMSNLIEQLKKSEKLCKDTYSESTIITRLTLKRIISALEESAKEPQSIESDLISKKTLIEEVRCMDFTTIANDGIEYIRKDMVMELINNQPQVQPISEREIRNKTIDEFVKKFESKYTHHFYFGNGYGQEAEWALSDIKDLAEKMKEV